METEPHLEALTQHVTGRLAIPGASAGAEVKVLMGSGSGIIVAGADRGPAWTAGDHANRVNAIVCWAVLW